MIHCQVFDSDFD